MDRLLGNNILEQTFEKDNLVRYVNDDIPIKN